MRRIYEMSIAIPSDAVMAWALAQAARSVADDVWTRNEGQFIGTANGLRWVFTMTVYGDDGVQERVGKQLAEFAAGVWFNYVSVREVTDGAQ